MNASAFQRLGGSSGLAEIIDDFIDRVTSDVMIGFFFRGVDKDKLKRLELSFAASHLGGPVDYQGRPLAAAHGPHRIMGGQFARRLKLLENTLRDHAVEEDIIQEWLAHNRKLLPHITRDEKDQCQAAEEPRASGSSPKTDGDARG